MVIEVLMQSFDEELHQFVLKQGDIRGFRTCFNCVNLTENEEHVLLTCPVNNDLRKEMLRNV